MRSLICLLVLLVAAPVLGCAQQPQPQPGPAQDPAAKAVQAPKAADVKLTEVVPDLPDFPNAVMVSSEEKGAHEGWTKTWKRETHITATYQDVRKFYVEQLEKKGWKISATKEKPGEIEWGLNKGASWGQVEIDADSAGIVKITVERKDR